jgi:hypothetical protein
MMNIKEIAFAVKNGGVNAVLTPPCTALALML